MTPLPLGASWAGGQYLSILLLAASSLAGALVFPVSAFGNAPPLSTGAGWWILLATAWLCLMLWARLYATLLARLLGLRQERSLFLAALCHLPLLLCLGLAQAVYTGDLAAQTFAGNSVGRQLFQPLARDYVIAVPLATQALVLAAHRGRALVRHLPLLALLLLALALRLSRPGWGLPGLLHPDEHRYIGPATIMVARGDLHPHYFENPSLMIYLAAGLFWLLTEHSIAFHLLDQIYNLGIPDPRGDFLQMVVLRGIVGLAGTLTVVAVYLSARELFPRRAALLGAALMSVGFLGVRNSHYATNDVLATCLLAFGFLFSVRVFTRGRTTDYLLAGIFGGLATTTKYSAGFFWLAILVAHWLRAGALQVPPRQPSPSGGRVESPGQALISAAARVIAVLPRRLLAPPLILAGVASLAAFAVGTPYALLDPTEFLAGFRSQFDLADESWLGPDAAPVPVLYLTTLMQGFGLVPLVLACLGVALAWRHDGRRLALLLSVPAVYMLFMLETRLFFARFALPALPYLAILAGYALFRLAERPAGALWRAGLLVVLLAAAVVQPLALSWRSNQLLGMEDTRSQAATWIERNTPPNSAIAIEAFAHQDNKFGWTGYQGRSTYVYWAENERSRARALTGEYQFVVTSSFGFAPWHLEGAAPGALAPEYAALLRQDRLVATFAPGPGNIDLPNSQDEMYTPFWHLFDRERPGPTVKIYRLGGTP